jgi:hypothetical protein
MQQVCLISAPYKYSSWTLLTSGFCRYCSLHSVIFTAHLAPNLYKIMFKNDYFSKHLFASIFVKKCLVFTKLFSLKSAQFGIFAKIKKMHFCSYFILLFQNSK